MIDMVTRFMNEYNYNTKTMRILPFKSAKYAFVKSVYWFYMKYSEIIRMIDNDRLNEDNLKQHTQYLKNTETQFRESFEKIAAANDIDELTAGTEEFFNRILAFNGYIRLYDRTFSFYFYKHDYDGVNYNDSGVNKFLENVISQLNFKRKEINAITILGAREAYGHLIREGFLDSFVYVPTYFKNNTLNNYFLIDHDNTYRRLIDMYSRENAWKKIIYGNFEETRTSTNFDIGFMGCQKQDYYLQNNPELCDLIAKMGELRSKVAKGGVMFLLMPRIFLTNEVLENIYTYMRNINIFFGGKSDAFAIVIGNRKVLRDKKLNEIIDLMKHVALGENLNCPIDIECLPMAEIRFRSFTPSKEELEEVIDANSTILHNFFNKATKNMELKTEEEIRHPLIPFGPGQLGLVLVSGKIDGIVDEGNGIYHVIKGSTRVEQNQHTTMTNSMERVVETVTSTGVSVAMLTASGKYIQLA